MAEVAATDTSAGDHGTPRAALYVVATPLGNLGDLGARAAAVLAAADRVLAEDTRVAATLLQHCGIARRATSLHEHNEERRTAEVLAWLAAGETVALVSDAGTPGISDPGARLVRAAHAGGHRVVPVPGPSAVAAAVSAAGLVAERYLFAGFLPVQAKARAALLDAFGLLPCALVFYEAPHRIRSTVAGLREALGGSRTLVVARELTKRFEEIARMPLSAADAWFDANANRERGEFVLVVDGPQPEAAPPVVLDAGVERWLAALAPELPPSAVARVAAAATGLPRELLYERVLALKARGSGD